MNPMSEHIYKSLLEHHRPCYFCNKPANLVDGFIAYNNGKPHQDGHVDVGVICNPCFKKTLESSHFQIYDPPAKYSNQGLKK
jgi:hypothetical protein